MSVVELIDAAGSIVVRPLATAGWVLKEIGDWYSLTTDKTPTTERPTAHGSFRARRSLRRGGSLSLEAHYIAGSAAELQGAMDRIGALGADAPILMRVTDSLRTTEREVRVVDVGVPDTHGRPASTVVIELWADDPRRYSVGDAWVSSALPQPPASGLTWPLVWPIVWGSGGADDGRLTLTNRGKRASPPSYRLYGGFSKADLIRVDTQQRVGIDLIVPFGSYVEVDFRTRRAKLNGISDVSRYLTWREWWTVEPEQSVTVQAEYESPGAGAYYAGLVRSAW